MITVSYQCEYHFARLVLLLITYKKKFSEDYKNKIFLLWVHLLKDVGK